MYVQYDFIYVLISPYHRTLFILYLARVSVLLVYLTHKGIFVYPIKLQFFAAIVTITVSNLSRCKI